MTAVMEYFNSTITPGDFDILSSPTLNNVDGYSGIGWFPRVLPEDRQSFIEYANTFYNGTFNIRTYSADGKIIPRPFDNQPIYPLFLGNPLAEHYVGFDNYIPWKPEFDEAACTGLPVSTNKLVLAEFAGPSSFQGNIVEYPIAYLVLHPVYKEGQISGMLINFIHPRGVLIETVKIFEDQVKDMNVFVFRKKNYEDGLELLFDYRHQEEDNVLSTFGVEDSLLSNDNSYIEHLVSDASDLTVVMTSSTSPSIVSVVAIGFAGFLFTTIIWYMYSNVLRVSIMNKFLSTNKSKFIAEMSHELRNPLNGIRGMVEVVSATTTDPTNIQCLDDMTTCSNMLLDMITDTLDFSKIESGKIQMIEGRASIKDFTASIMRLMSFYTRSTKVISSVKLILEMDETIPETPVISDFTKLNRIIMNLVSNSIKFTQSGYIKVSLSVVKDVPKHNSGNTFLCDKYEDDVDISYLRITVEDSGSGMSQSCVNNLFKPFTQVQLGRVSTGGTGLGLVICKSFAEHMGGMITCKSVVDTGTTFTVWVRIYSCDNTSHILPYEEEWMIRDSQSGSTMEHVKDVKDVGEETIDLLIVDDSTVNIRLIEMFLRDTGKTYDSAYSGEEALHKCERVRYRNVFLDYHMGGINGVDAGRMIHESRLNSSARISILTADEYSPEIKQSGFAFIQKPFTRKDIHDILL